MVWMGLRLRREGGLVLCLLRGRGGLIELVPQSLSTQPPGLVVECDARVLTGFKHLVQSTHKVRTNQAVEIRPAVDTRNLGEHTFDPAVDSSHC
jgi:hypothetical protein